MHSTRDDATTSYGTEPGTPAHVVDIVVLSTDGGLLATLRAACTPQHALWHAPSADAAVDYLVGGRCGILIADLDALRGDVAALFDRLHAQFPELVLIASGRREAELSVAPLLSEGRIFRFLHKPLSPARAELFVATATRRYAEVRHAEPLLLTTVRTLAARRNWGALVAGAVAVLGAAILFFIWRSASDSDTEPPLRTQYGQDAAHRVSDALAHAQIAYVAGRLVEPRGDNALEYFQNVLQLQPEHAEARAGIERVVAALESRVQSALQARDPALGAIALTRLQRARPDHPHLDDLREQLLALPRATGQGTTNTNATQRAAPAQPRLASHLELARLRIASGQLLEPFDDSARTHLQRAREAGEDHTLFNIVATDLGMQLLDRATAASAAGDDGEARDWLDAARALDLQFDLALPQLPETSAHIELTAATRADQLASQLAAVAQLRERGQLIEPTGENAYDTLVAMRDRAGEHGAFLAEQQRVVFALLEAAHAALATHDLHRAETLAARAEVLVPGMTTTRALLDEIAATRAASPIPE